jgi:hypothetical protein
MVTRKPVPQTSSLAAPSSAPYPGAPSSADNFESDAEENAWTEEGLEKQRHPSTMELPEALRVGPKGYTPASSQENFVTTNPFLKKANTGGSSVAGESSADAWGGPTRPSEPLNAPPPPPLPKGTPYPIEPALILTFE